MALQYTSITGNSVQTLINKKLRTSTTTGLELRTFSSSLIKAISICNNHATDSVVVDLYLYDSVLGEFSILNSAVIPTGVTLVLDDKDVAFDNSSYEMRIKLDQADSDVDIIIK